MNKCIELGCNQLIVTRPAGLAGSLFEKLHRAAPGILFKHLPLISISPLEYQLSHSSQVDGAIFISRNAVEYFSVDLLGTEVILTAVGDNTASLLEQNSGRKVIYPEQMNSEGLIKLAALYDIKGQHWLIVKGQGGRTLINDTLLERGAIVDEIEVYKRKLPDFSIQQALKEAHCDNTGWIITSGEALTNLYRILGLASYPKHRVKVIISSDRLAHEADMKGFEIIAQSEGASEAQLVQCVKRLVE